MAASSRNLVASALVILVGCQAAPRPPTDRDATGREVSEMAVTPEQAVEAAARFIGLVRPDLDRTPQEVRASFADVQEDHDPTVGPVWELSGSLGLVGVAAATGEVVSYNDLDEAQGGDPRLTMEEAENVALRFLRIAHPRFSDERFRVIDRREGDGRFDFSLEQVRVPPEVSIYANVIDVAVRSDTPRVVSYGRTALAFVRTDPPRLSEADARQRVREIVGPDARITAMDLQEQPTDDLSRAVTVWAASVVRNHGGIETLDLVLIDADTGSRVRTPE
jgi:hypothetical protein